MKPQVLAFIYPDMADFEMVMASTGIHNSEPYKLEAERLELTPPRDTF